MSTQKATRAKMYQLIPFLDPKKEHSALAVLRHVRRVIARDPKRLNMSDWESAYLAKRGVRSDGCECDLCVAERTAFEESMPRCGTVACLGGWINITTGHREGNISGIVSPGERALKHLGLKNRDSGGAWYALDDLFSDGGASHGDVLEQLDAIMRDHRKELLAAKAKVRAPKHQPTK